MLKGTRGRKGQADWMEIFMTILLACCLVIVALKIPDIMKDIATLLTIASGEATARDLGGLITISGAAQDAITITYEGADESIFYDVELKDRMVHITNIRTEYGEIIRGEESPIKTGWGKIGVDDPKGEFENVRVFTIEKTRVVTEDETRDAYDISAE